MLLSRHSSELVKGVFFVALGFGTAAILVMILGFCESDEVREYPTEKCTNDELCVKFISSYILECKYHNRHSFLVFLLFCTILVFIFLVDLAAFALAVNASSGGSEWLRGDAVTVLTVCCVVGLSFIFCFDSKSLHGIYGQRYFEGYGVDNSLLHGFGVVLFFGANVMLHLTIIMHMVSNHTTQLLQLDVKLDFVYMCSVALFIFFFLIDNIVVATVLEYITTMMFVVMVYLAVLTYCEV